MKKYLFFAGVLLCYFFSFLACRKNAPGSEIALPFDSIPVIKPVIPLVNETSGIADSKVNPGFLWIEEDSGNPPELEVLKHDGNVIKKIYIRGAINRDWEEMAISGDQVYIGDIGDNAQNFPEYRFYKFQEPLVSADTVVSIDTIRFKYPDGSHDAEAFLVDPLTNDIYIITKQDNPSRIYKLGYPYSTAVTTTSLTGTLTFGGVVSSAFSPDGKEIIIKTYTSLYYYSRKDNESIMQVLEKNFTSLPYHLEPQGEAVCFASDNSGIFTLSEKGFATTVDLYFYKRR